MNRRILISVFTLLFFLLSGCRSVDLPKRVPGPNDTVVIGRWIRYDAGEKADWFSAFLRYRKCYGNLNDINFSLDDDTGFFAILLPDPGEKKMYGTAYSSFALVCEIEMGAHIVLTSKLFEIRLPLAPHRIYVLPTLRFFFSEFAAIRADDIKMDASRRSGDSVVEEFRRKYAAWEGLGEIFIVKADDNGVKTGPKK